METILFGNELITLQSIDSTNNYAANMNKQGLLADGAVIMAYNQTNGRGQRGNSWKVESSKNLTFSIFWKSSSILVSEQFKLSMALSLGIINYLKANQVDARIKWPNDIYVGKEKIAGILIENSLRGNKIANSIIGVGLNLNQTNFGSFSATSLSKLTGSEYDIDKELTVLLTFIEPELLKLRSITEVSLKNLYYESLIGYQDDFEYVIAGTETICTGRIIEVKSDGKVLVLSNNQESEFDLKEIVFKL